MDVIHDNSKRGWIKVAHSHEVPAYVGEHIPLTKEASAKLSDDLFADDAKRLFPINSKADVWLSAAYFKEAAADYSEAIGNYVKDRIKEAAAVFGISEDVDQAFEAAQVKVASAKDDPDNYCWVDEKGKYSYPVFDKEGAAKAVSYFEDHRLGYPLDTRIKLARNILKKACDYGLEPTETLMKEAGFAVPNRAKLMGEILERARMTDDPEAAIKFAQINEVIANSTNEEFMENLDKIAEVIDALDGVNGMRHQYNVKILSPQESIYSMSVKEANDILDDSLVLNRHTFKLSKMAELNPETFNVLGDNFSDELSTDGKLDVKKMATILPTLPTPDKRLLEEEIEASFGVV
jgi:hypothetical protein